MPSASGFWRDSGPVPVRDEAAQSRGVGLSEGANGGSADAYHYVANSVTPVPGNTALLDDVTLGLGGTRDYSFGVAGHLGQVDAAGNVLDFTTDQEGRLCETDRGVEHVAVRYDGRSFLSRAEPSTGIAASFFNVASSSV